MRVAPLHGMLALLLAFGGTSSVAAEPAETMGGQGLLAMAPTQALSATPGLLLGAGSAGVQTTTQESTTTVITEKASCPFSLTLNYAIYSDYIFRGVNFSEYDREGREMPNHQLDVSFEGDLGTLLHQDEGSMGTLTFGSWFEWYAAQKKLDPISGGQNLQEIDYYINWAYDIESISSTLTLGYVFYTLPNAKAANTSEWSVGLEHNDAWMWKWLWPENEDGVLNPSFFLAHDVDAIAGATWMELGFSHEFALTDRLTLTPSLTVGIDHRYLDPVVGTGKTGSTRLAYFQYGLNADYDLSAAWSLPENIGAVTVSGFLYFSDAVGNPEHSRTIQDEFFGGVSLTLSF